MAIPVDLSDEKHPLLITRIEDAAWHENTYLRIGRDVIIVGYPFGMRPENPYPIWKRGFVASEPFLLVDGMPKYYVDSPGRPGMSGSPMFMVSPGRAVSKATRDLLEDKSLSPLAIIQQIDVEELMGAPEINMMQFAGVYAGSFGESKLEEMRLGIAWHAAMVDRLFNHPVAGSTHLDG